MPSSILRHPARALPLLALLIVCGTASAQLGPPTLPIFPWPGDTIYLGIPTGGCPTSYLDETRPARAKQVSRSPSPFGDPEGDLYVHEVHYWMNKPALQACVTPPPRHFRHSIDLGVLPPGIHDLRITEIENNHEKPVRSIRILVRENLHAPEDITGAWYAPEQSGRGVFMATHAGVTAVWWSTHDVEGKPLWLMMVGTEPTVAGVIEGEAITTVGPPLAPGPARLEAQRWGHLRLRYRGCGRAELQLQADDPALGEGKVELVQLMLPAGIEPCSPLPGTPRMQAIWDRE